MWMNFAIQHAHAFGDTVGPRLRMNAGSLAFDYLLDRGGSAYLAEGMVQRAAGGERLHRIMDAPVFERTVYATYKAGGQNEPMLKRVLDMIRSWA